MWYFLSMKQQRQHVQKTKIMSSEIEKMRHTTSHVLAMAVLKLFPDTKLGVGPVIDNGYYYDFLFTKPFSADDLTKIEAEMQKIVKENLPLKRIVLSKVKALGLEANQPYKKELISEIPESEEISFYVMGNNPSTDYEIPTTDFIDLCAGPHLESTGKIGAFKLTHSAGAYWKGSEKNQMLTRIYGLAFESQEDIDSHLNQIEEAKKRDHRILGPQLDLYSFSDLVGPGLPLWAPKGVIVRNLLDDYIWSLRRKFGFEKVEIPHITKKDLYEKSGHWDKFKDELFKINTREGHLFCMKPMNCPHHTQIFARRKWSYKDLPQRYANTTMCYRDEQTGELNGLSRLRSFTQDDAHVFCQPDQVKAEMLKIWDIVERFYGTFGFDLKLRLSLHDPANLQKYLGDPKSWEFAEGLLRDMAKEKGAEFYEGIGEAAFYGPKLDFMGTDSLNREWQVATIQLDVNMPGRFELVYTSAEGKEETPLMIHAAIMGSIERFLSILIEHYAGAFPLWLAPEQVVIIPISERHAEYAKSVEAELLKHDIRVKLDDRNETLGKKIRESEVLKVPYTLVVGDKEIEAKAVSVRAYSEGDKGSQNLTEFITKIIEEINTKH